MDEITKPKHYTQGKVECLDAIESMIGRESFIDYLRAQIMKYTWRLKDKGNPVEDAGKLHFYSNKLNSYLR